jgi:hypothetical protein
MHAGGDVLQTVEYRTDKKTMRRVPLALLLCLAGLALVIHVDPRPPNIGVLAMFVGMLTAWLLAKLAFNLMFEGFTGSARWLAAGFTILASLALIALASIVRDWNVTGPVLDYRGRPHPPANILGWMLVMGAVAWIAVALYRHVIPAQPPPLMLSPAGITCHAGGLKGLLIPWHDIRGVDALEATGPSGFPFRYEDRTVVLVTAAFYERHILSRRSAMAPPGSDRLFVPKGALMQVLLPHEWFAIEPRHMREPVEARWKAFRGAAPAVPSIIEPNAGARQVYGAWSNDGSLWQALAFLVPLIGIAALLAAYALRLSLR